MCVLCVGLCRRAALACPWESETDEDDTMCKVM